MRVIGVDPSLTTTGLAAVDLQARKIVDWKVLASKPGGSGKGKTDDFADRLYWLGRGFREFHDLHGGLIVIEGQVGASMGKAGMGSVFKLGAAYGAFLGAANSKPIVIPPATVKSRLTGNAGSSKAECFAAAVARLNVDTTSMPAFPKAAKNSEAVQDAVSVIASALPELEQLSLMYASQVKP